MTYPDKNLIMFRNKGAKGSQKEPEGAPKGSTNHAKSCKNARKRIPRATPRKVDPLKGSRDGQNMKI